MTKWTDPEIFSLGFDATKGNPATKGNDSAIPDCIENAFQCVFGDHSGNCPEHNGGGPSGS